MKNQKIVTAENATQYVGEKKQKMKRKFVLNTKVIIALQVFLIAGLSIFITSKLISYFAPSFVSSNTNSPRVAGLSEIAIPESVSVSVSDKTYNFQTQDFEFQVKTVNEYDENSLQFRLNKITNVLGIDIPVSPQRSYHVIEYNQTKLEYWFINRFAELETEDKIEALMTFEEDEESIAQCQIGSGSQKIPLKEFMSKFENEIPEVINLKVIATNLTPKEKFINSICENIENFEETIASISYLPLGEKDKDKKKTIDFIDKTNSRKFFSYQIENNQLKIILKDEANLENEFKKLKAIIDQEPQNYEYRIKKDTFYLIGEFKPGKVLNIDSSIEHMKDDIKDLFKFEKIDLVFNETDQDIQKSNLNVEQYPVFVAEGILRSPLQPIDRINSIRNTLFVVDAITIEPNSTFSLNNYLNEFIQNPNNVYDKIIVKNEASNIEYYDSIQAVSSLLFRTLLEAGLKNTQYLDIQKALYMDHYSYPYENALLTTSLAQVSQDNLSIENIDLIFENPLDQPLLLITDEEIKNDQYVIKARVFAKSGYKNRRIELKNFERSTFSQDDQDGFIESFVQFVDGNEQKFITYYLK